MCNLSQKDIQLFDKRTDFDNFNLNTFGVEFHRYSVYQKYWNRLILTELLK